MNREAAKAVAALGLPVFRLHPERKTPAFTDWQKEATTDPDRIDSLWAVGGRPWNIGVSTRGLLVVDADCRAGKRGLETIALLGVDTETLTVRTPSGGLHLYFKPDAPVGNSSQRIGPDVDVRGEGGYVVAPGSRLDRKHLDNKGSHGEYVWERRDPIRKTAPWLNEAAGRAPAAQRHTNDPGTDHPIDVESARLWLADRKPAVEGDGGDAWTYATAAGLRDYGLTKATALELLTDWNERCQPPWSDADLAAKIENAWAYAQNPGGERSLPAAIEALPDIRPPELDDSRWFFHGDPCKLSTSWLIYKVLPARGVVVLSGPSYSGKTFMALEVARALGAGGTFFGSEADNRGGTIVLAGEGGAGMRLRLAALQHDSAAPLPIGGRAAVALCAKGALASLEVDLAAKMAAMKAYYGVPVRLLVLDTVSSTGLVQDENDNSEVGRAIAALGVLSERLGVLVLLVHHPSSSGKTERGASAFFNNADAVLRIRRDDAPHSQLRVLELAKLKEGMAPRDLGAFKLAAVELGLDDRGRPVESCRVEPVNLALGTPDRWAEFETDLEVARAQTKLRDDEGRAAVPVAQLVASAQSLAGSPVRAQRLLNYALSIGMLAVVTAQGQAAYAFTGQPLA